MNVLQAINDQFKLLIDEGIRNTTTLSNRLTNYCYNTLNVSNNNLWTYIDNLTMFSSGIDELTDQQVIKILCTI